MLRDKYENFREQTIAILIGCYCRGICFGRLFRQRKNQRTSVSNQSNPLSKYHKPIVCEKVSIANATFLDGIIEVFNDSSLMLQDGKIVAIGNDLEVSGDGVTIDAKANGHINGR